MGSMILLIIVEKNLHVLDYFYIKSENVTDRTIQRNIYSKTCLKQPLKNKTENRFSKPITLYHFMKVESIAECSKRAFCNTFYLH